MRSAFGRMLLLIRIVPPAIVGGFCHNHWPNPSYMYLVYRKAYDCFERKIIMNMNKIIGVTIGIAGILLLGFSCGQKAAVSTNTSVTANTDVTPILNPSIDLNASSSSSSTTNTTTPPAPAPSPSPAPAPSPSPAPAPSPAPSPIPRPSPSPYSYPY